MTVRDRLTHHLRGVAVWWRSRSRRQAHVVMLVAGTLAFLGGLGFSGLVAAQQDDGPAARTGAPMPGATLLGPVSLVLPEGLGPWATIPADRMAEALDEAETDGAVLEGGWGVVAPDSVLVTVMTVEAGTHGGLETVTGPVEDDGEVTVPWRDGLDHRAGSQVVDGVREVTLAVELADGRLVVVSLSGPEGTVTPAELEPALSTLRITP